MNYHCASVDRYFTIPLLQLLGSLNYSTNCKNSDDCACQGYRQEDDICCFKDPNV